MTALAPALRLMNRLPYRAKLAVLAGIVALTNLGLAWTLGAALLPRYQTTRGELVALDMLAPSLSQIQLIQRHRGLNSGLIVGYAEAATLAADIRRRVDENFAGLLELEGRTKPFLGDTEENAVSLRAEWQSLLVNGNFVDRQESLLLHTELINRLLRYQLQIAHAGKLPADPELETHELIEIVVERMPTILEQMGLLRAKGTAIVASGQIDEQQRGDIIGHIHMLNHALIGLRRNIHSLLAIQHNDRRSASAQRMYDEINEACTLFTEVVTQALLERRQTVPPRQYFETTSKAIDLGFSHLRETLIPEIRNQLEARQHKLRTQLLFSLGGSLAVFCLLLYLLAALYRSVMDSVRSLSEAADAVSRADFTKTVTLEAQDELARVAESFNAMLAALDAMIGRGNTRTEANELAAKGKEGSRLDELVRERTRSLEEALSKARLAEKAKDDFLANISHEMRTPLNAIIGLSGLALRDPLDARQRSHIEKVHQSGEHLLAVINDVLDLSKIVAGHMRLVPEHFDLAEQMARVIAIVGAKATEKSLRLESHIAADVPQFIHGDALRISQIVMNLLSNASKFTDAGSIRLGIEVASRTAQDLVLRISVADTGIGMSEEDCRRLFQPFVQADNSITRKYGGTGLGLAICKQLVEMMGGEIGVDSLPGQGSTFRFTLRVEPGIAPQARHAPTSGWANFAAMMRFDQVRVMVADDHAMNRQIAEELLHAMGIAVDCAIDGREAVDRLIARGPAYYDLVLMDLQMPKLDGITATAEIRALAGFADLPIIAMTAHVLAEERQSCIEAGMNDHIGKPFSPTELMHMVARWLPSKKVFPLATDTATAVATEAAHQPSAPSACREDVAPVVFDTDSAMARFSGKIDKYHQWLSNFAKAQAASTEVITEHLASNRTDEAARLAHLIKGQAGTLGMSDLQRCTSDLERALKSGDNIAASLARYAVELERALRTIHAMTSLP